MSLSFLSPLGEFQFAQVERKLLLNIASLEKYSYFNNRDPTQFITYILLFPIIHLYFNEQTDSESDQSLYYFPSKYLPNHNFVGRENRREKESKNDEKRGWAGDFRSAPTNFIRGQRGKRRMSNPSAPFNESHSSSNSSSPILAHERSSNGRKRAKNIESDWRPANGNENVRTRTPVVVGLANGTAVDKRWREREKRRKSLVHSPFSGAW